MNETIAMSLKRFIDDLQENRLDLSKQEIYERFPTFHNPELQMALVSVVQSCTSGPALENLMREDVKKGLNKISQDFGVELIISALKDELHKEEIANGLQNVKIDNDQLESLEKSLHKI